MLQTKMTGPDFGRWLNEKDISIQEVANETGLHPNTIYSFINRVNSHTSTRRALELFKERYLKEQAK